MTNPLAVRSGPAAAPRSDRATPARSTLAQPTDEELVRRARNGDDGSFERLLKRYQRPIVNFLYRMAGDFDHAVDIAQEVFTKAFVALDRFDDTYRFSTWLYRIASNCAIDHLRKHRPPTISLDAPLPGAGDGRFDGGLRFELPSVDAGPDERFEYRETAGRLSRAIRKLPAAYRQLILLRHVQHLRYDEIADVTGLPLGTVKNRIFRARNLLRGMLGRPEAAGRPQNEETANSEECRSEDCE